MQVRNFVEAIICRMDGEDIKIDFETSLRMSGHNFKLDFELYRENPEKETVYIIEVKRELKSQREIEEALGQNFFVMKAFCI